MRDHKIDLAICEVVTKGLPFDTVKLADMARWYMTRCTGLEVQLKCAEDANDQLKAGAEVKIKRLSELGKDLEKARKDAFDLMDKAIAMATTLETENQRLRDLITEALSDMSSITDTYNCCDTCKHAEGESECPDLHLEQCRGWEWRRADALGK